ncbi:MAG: hypothetical protein ABF436_08140, partial [Acetobacter okinawensis]|uniref:hypothetical protein n=1 Tax=Acetobacter okinawensis TaxID=1076594 RepID=UPI0039EC0378
CSLPSYRGGFDSLCPLQNILQTNSVAFHPSLFRDRSDLSGLIAGVACSVWVVRHSGSGRVDMDFCAPWSAPSGWMRKIGVFS